MTWWPAAGRFQTLVSYVYEMKLSVSSVFCRTPDFLFLRTQIKIFDSNVCDQTMALHPLILFISMKTFDWFNLIPPIQCNLIHIFPQFEFLLESVNFSRHFILFFLDHCLQIGQSQTIFVYFEHNFRFYYFSISS